MGWYGLMGHYWIPSVPWLETFSHSCSCSIRGSFCLAGLKLSTPPAPHTRSTWSQVWICAHAFALSLVNICQLDQDIFRMEVWLVSLRGVVGLAARYRSSLQCLHSPVSTKRPYAAYAWQDKPTREFEEERHPNLVEKDLTPRWVYSDVERTLPELYCSVLHVL
jgi:hypothetical protein